METCVLRAGPRCNSCPAFCFAMTTILDDQLYSHSDRLAGKVVLITGECQFLTCATAMPIGVAYPAPAPS